MSTTAKILLDTRRQRINGTYPLIIRLTHERNSTSIPLEIELFENDWDHENLKIRKTCRQYENIPKLNNLIQKQLTNYNDKIIDLRDKKQLHKLSVSELKKMLVNKNGGDNFCKYAISIAESMEKKGEIGNAKVYRHAESFIKRHNNNQDVTFSLLTYSFLKKIEESYLSKGRSLNGLSTQMRTIRAIYNRAIKEGLVSKDNYPFENYNIRSQETRKRAISKDEIKKIENLELKEDSGLWHARNYFLFSFYCRGMNFIDIALLKIENISDGKIIYRRSKSKFKKIYSITIVPKIQEILDFYLPFIEKPENDSYVFPIIKSKKPIEMRLEIDNARRLINKKLKDIGKSCEINQTITFYVSRHTWANTAKKLGYSVETIGDGLGHSNTKTTQIYLESFGDDVLDDVNKSIIS